MKKILSWVLILCLMASLTLVVAEEEKVLNVFTWATYIDDVTVANFTAETGIKINYTTFGSNEEMLIKMTTAPDSYDLILASDYALNTLRKQDLLQKLDKSLISNYQNIGAAFLSQYFDEKNEYVIPYTAGTPLIVYNPDVVNFELTGYESLWDERLKDSIVVVDDARNIIGITLKTMGHSLNTTDEAVLKQAEEKLMKLRSNIRSFNYDTPHTDLLSGEVSVAYMFTPFVVLALNEMPTLKVVYPQEGMGFGIDGLVIPANAPHPKNAHAFLNFILDSKNAAHIAETQCYLCPVQTAYEFLPEGLKNNPAINIPQDDLGKTEMMQDVGELESVYQGIWQRFKMAQ